MICRKESVFSMKKIIILKKIMQLVTAIVISSGIYLLVENYKLYGTYVILLIIILLLVLLILEAVTLQSVGVPNNVIKSDFICIDENEITSIEIQECDKGIWRINGLKSNVYFDMTGWIKQKKHIYNLIVIKLLLDKYNIEKKSAFSLVYKNVYSKIDNLKMVFRDSSGKISTKFLIKKGKYIKTLYIRYRFRMCLYGSHFNFEHSDFKYYEILLSDLYRFRK